VSSVSCIYGLGSPEAYEGLMLELETGKTYKRQSLLRKLFEIQYRRNDVDFHRGTFRVRGDVVEIYPAYEEERAIRIEFFGDEIETISVIDALRGIKLESLPKVTLFPASHYVTTAENRKRAVDTIRDELRERLQELKSLNKLLEAQRLEQRTLYDLEMLEQVGFCQGIENYSRHLTGRSAGEAPPTLIEYFPDDWLLIVDESHVTIPQIGGMYRGDRARKLTLVEHGFRLPSALDNRPLNFEEWEKLLNQAVYVSATPGEYELGKTGGEVVEQVIRPTGLLDPEVEVRKAGTQVDDLLGEVRKVVDKGQRVLITTLTKKLSEDLTRYYAERGIRVKYLHSDIDTIERIEILRQLRTGDIDIIVGINLLREGLDLPEVSYIAILDADKQGFLRSRDALIQTIGRAARNVRGHVTLYADKMTDAMKQALDETTRRRTVQEAYNKKHGITPQTIIKAVHDIAEEGRKLELRRPKYDHTKIPKDEKKRLMEELEKQMEIAAQNLEFEKAADLRDEVELLRRELK
jgi:excinuclease ABC subunit B